nr:protein FAR1-RELATED SEQUENCE 5-like [Ipomoea batatas]
MAGVETLHSEPRLPLIASPATGNLFRQLVGGSFFSFRDVYVVYLAVLSDWVPYGSMLGVQGGGFYCAIGLYLPTVQRRMDALFTQTECTITYSSNNTKFWAPNCDDSVGPYLGQMFGTVEQGEVFYFEYARAVGFDVRRSTVKKDRSGNTTVRHLVCSRQGFKQILRDQCVQSEGGNGVATSGSRRRTSNRVGCPARGNNGVNNHMAPHHKLWVDFQACLALAGEDRDRMVIVGNAVQSLKEALSVEDNSAPVRRGKRSVIENFCGSGVAEPIVIRPPVVARNKGRRKRLKGAREIAVASKKKGERTCATCGLANGHDSRNCELREKNPDSEGWF